jgi:Zn-dependent peptidase ImmA (M78 family)/DNA-binding XRE family transcriptional regulator
MAAKDVVERSHEPLDELDPRVLGATLRRAREDRGWTQERVGQHLGVARTTIVAMEKGERRVKPEELVDLATLYGRRLSSLLQRGSHAEGFAVQLRGALPPATPIEAELLPHIQEFQSLCEDYLRLEELRRAPLRRRYPSPYDVEKIDPLLAAEDVASEERRRLGLGDGPLLNLREILEGDVGLRIFLLRLPSKVAGMYAFTEALGGCIALNLGHPPERQRQTLTHEYGHFLTSRFRSEVLEEGRYERRPRHEWFAEEFGRAFLMPASGVRRRFLDLQRERQKSVTRGDICRLAHFFAVSVEAMVRRLEELQLVPGGLWDRLLREGFRAREAQRMLGLDMAAPPEQPLPLRYLSLALESWHEGDLSEGQLAQIVRVSRLGARELLGNVGLAGQESAGSMDLGAPLVGTGSG